MVENGFNFGVGVIGAIIVFNFIKLIITSLIELISSKL